jgi:hypothetical protein
MSESYRPPSFGNESRYAGEPRRGYTSSIPVYLVVTILTFGIFNLYWNYCQMRTCNELLNRSEFSFGLWLLLCIVTCGLYHLYYQYMMGAAINEIQVHYGLPVAKDLPILSVIAALVGFGIIADCIHQHEINKIDAELE